MHRDLEDPELSALRRRFVTPERRYLRLGGSLLRLGGPERAVFAREMGCAAAEITPREVEILLDAGWRERKVAAWLIAVTRRAAFRERLGALLLASEAPYAGAGYCVALARLGTAADAGLLTAYLERYLPRTDLPYDQGLVLGTLLHLDTEQGTAWAARFLAPGGPWQRWQAAALPGRTVQDPDRYRQVVADWCAFAAQCHQATGHP
ncbi:DUF6000 family protein [Streptomyces sp. NPDC001380]|uniref:DUF6000 family protein n=1 Tax=Streptomyces sp. NPDC001380 TaxID=3364566 RepID=UPI0036C4D385